MRYFKKWQLAIVCLVTLILPPIVPIRHGQAQAVTYTVTDLGTLGGTQSKAHAIDNCGRVAGDSPTASSDGNLHPFFWSERGGMIDLGTFGGSRGAAFGINTSATVTGNAATGSGEVNVFIWTAASGKTDIGTLPTGSTAVANDINDSNQLVGTSDSGTGGVLSNLGFIWQPSTGTMQPIPAFPGGGSSFANGINNAGQVVGAAQISTGKSHAFVLTHGTMLDLGTLENSGNSIAHKINDEGQVVGFSDLFFTGAGGPKRAFIWSPTMVMTNMNPPGHDGNSSAHDINNSGQAVGAWDVSPGVTHAFIYTQASGMSDLNDSLAPDSNWTLSEARSINDRGQIVGFGINPDGNTHAFLLTPDNVAPSPCDAMPTPTPTPTPEPTPTPTPEPTPTPTPEPTPTPQPTPTPALVNVALASNGATAVASSTLDAGRSAQAVINGDRQGMHWGTDPSTGSGWHDSTDNAYPDWVEVTFPGTRTLHAVNVFSVQDNYSSPSDPTEALVFTKYGVTDMQIEYWDGAAWAVVPGATVVGNNKVWAKFAFAPINTTKMRVVVTGALAGYTRITEIEAMGEATAVTPPTRVNHALVSSGATATSSSTLDAGRSPVAAINGDRRGMHWGTDASTGSGWHDSTNNAYPDWLEVNFAGTRSVDEVSVFSVQDNYSSPSEPTESLSFTNYGVTDMQVEYWDGAAWASVPGGAIAANTKVWRKVTFAAINTTKIRVVISGAMAGYSRLTEVEAWGVPDASTKPNVAAAANGATVTASSTLDAGRSPVAAINGDRRGQHWGSDAATGSGWHDSTDNAYPDWLEVTFAGPKTIGEVDVFSVQDAYASPSEPFEGMTFTKYGVTNFEVEYWDGAGWQTVTGGVVANNNKVWRKVTFASITTPKIRVKVTGAMAGYTRITEVEAY